MQGSWEVPLVNQGTFTLALDSPDLWEGTFSQRGQKSPQSFEMIFTENGIFGVGSDTVGAYVIRGSFHKGSGQATFGKQYFQRHIVIYSGNVIMAGPNWQINNGNWQIPNNSMGVFSISRSTPQQLPPPPN